MEHEIIEPYELQQYRDSFVVQCKERFNTTINPEEFRVISVEILQMSVRHTWSVQLFLVKNYTLVYIEQQVLENLKKQCPELYEYDGKFLQQIKLSRFDLKLIENDEDLAQVSDGTRLWINHIKRDDIWKVLTLPINHANAGCCWCFKPIETLEVYGCDFCNIVKYCCEDHMKISEKSHSLVCTEPHDIIINSGKTPILKFAK